MFFKHKYLTQPIFIASGAILCASDNICAALNEVLPESTPTQTEIDKLMEIFKRHKKPVETETETDTQRVLRNNAQAQRVETKEDDKIG